MKKRRTFLVLIDSSKEMHVALKFACLRANSVNGHVALAYIIEESKGGEYWLSTSGITREEARVDAEKLLDVHSKKVKQWTGNVASIFFREGNIAQQFAQLIEEEKSISIAVLAASTQEANPGPVISHLISNGMGNLRIPITIVPGNMKDSELAGLS